MDVRCNRCGTEYEFDDALVSERGTTVKCTNCGHQFRVYPGGGRKGLPERWIVRKASGRELIYTSLKDMQRAIAQRQVGPADMLSRGEGGPMRALGGIAELEPFFRAQTGAAPQGQARTLLGISPPSSGSTRPGEEDTEPDHAPLPSTGPEFGATMPSAQRGRAASRPPPGGVGQAQPETNALHAPRPEDATRRYDEDATRSYDEDTTRRYVGPPPNSVEPPTNPRLSPYEQLASSSVYDAKTVIAPPSAPATQPAPMAPMRAASRTPVPASAEQGRPDEERAYRQEDDAEPMYPSVPAIPQRSPVPWIFAALAVGVVILGATLGRKYISQLSGKDTAAPTQSDARVVAMLRAGNEAFDRGDLEGAKEQLDKATVLADRDANVRAALARLEAARADIHWLAIKLIGTNDEMARQAEQQKLQARLDKVRRSAEQAAAVAPSEPFVLRARIDAHRLGGELAKARELVGALASNASEPETAYVLAALDIAEPSPEWSTVIDRLRTAEGVEGAIGRARAALVYALASSGQVEEAKAKLEKIQPSHPLAERLRAFVEKSRSVAGDAGAVALAASAAPAPGESTLAKGGAEASAAGPAGMDFRKLLEEASRAQKAGDLARAEQFYQAAQSKQPGNVEALAGLGDVAKARGDNAAAARYYDSVLAANPSYLPTLMARADLKWAAGDHAGAVALYRKVVQQTGPGTSFGQRAASRIQEHEGATGAKPAAAEPIPTEPAPSPNPPPASTSESPHIDTSDLPGFNK